MATPTRKWRKTRQKVRGRTYWSLQAGARKSDDRVSMSLGYVSESEAERALEAMQREEAITVARAAYDRVLRLFKKDKQAARDYLVGDEAMEALFGTDGPVEPAWEHLPIREYVDSH